ncbi:MAG TPA: NAD(+)/NADH kinase [Methanoregulaceae archaeon]|nr:NAD(+)/NADH kinase [Methanoregulaceae archaeon]
MDFLLVSRIDDARALAYTSSLGGSLIESGHTVSLESATAGAMNLEGVPIPEARPDAIVIVGGDGTILLSVQKMERQIPIIGVNWGEVGFLADLEPDKALKFLKSLKPGFSIEKRMRISLSSGGELLGQALNEALIVTTRPAKMLRFVIVVDGVPAERFRSDGLLLSTPTGSTAYAMSAGGPIVDPRIEGVLLVPLAPYMLSSRPHLIHSDRSLEVRLESRKPATLVIDGQASSDIGCEASILVKKSDEPVLFVDARRNFFEKVNDKLRRL